MLTKTILILSVILFGFGALVAMPEIAFAGSVKVDVCHIPPGNPENFHSITISENAIGTHLAHNDLSGACNGLCVELCDDGDPCTIDDTGDCETAGCPATREPTDCDDGNLCTVNACDSATGGCTAVPVDCGTGASCFADSGACVPNNCFAATYDETEYWICQGSRTRPQAVDFCEGEGMQLAYIADAAENAFVVDTALAEYDWIDFSTSSYWISNTKGTSDVILPYAPGEPSGDGIYHHILRYADSYGWNDVPDSYTWGWVCETTD